MRLFDRLVLMGGAVVLITGGGLALLGKPGDLPRVPSGSLLRDPGEGAGARLQIARQVRQGVFPQPPGLIVRVQQQNATTAWTIMPGEDGTVNQYGGPGDEQLAEAGDVPVLRARRIYLQQARRATVAKVTPEQIAALRAIENAPEVASPAFRKRAAELFEARRTSTTPDQTAAFDQQLMEHVSQLLAVDTAPIRAKNAERAKRVREILSADQLTPPPQAR